MQFCDIIEKYNTNKREFIIGTILTHKPGYPGTIDAFSLQHNTVAVNASVLQFRDLVMRNQVSGNERNIEWWRIQGWDKFNEFVTSKSSLNTKTQIKRKKIPGKSITLRDDNEWLIVIPLDENASRHYGKGTNWCTSVSATYPAHLNIPILQTSFYSYFHEKERANIYCINKSGDKWSITVQIRFPTHYKIHDAYDNQMGQIRFKDQTGLDISELFELLFNNLVVIKAEMLNFEPSKLVIDENCRVRKEMKDSNPEVKAVEMTVIKAAVKRRSEYKQLYHDEDALLYIE